MSFCRLRRQTRLRLADENTEAEEIRRTALTTSARLTDREHLT